jgi:hypothetical protein
VIGFEGATVEETDGWRVVTAGSLPPNLDDYLAHADFVDRFGGGATNRDPDPPSCFLAVAEPGEDRPSFVAVVTDADLRIVTRCDAVFAPETGRLFVGGPRQPRLYVRDEAGWRTAAIEGLRDDWPIISVRRHDDVVVVESELELLAYTLDGSRLWAEYPDPPYTYEIVDGLITIHEFFEGDRIPPFALHDGPNTYLKPPLRQYPWIPPDERGLLRRLIDRLRH